MTKALSIVDYSLPIGSLDAYIQNAMSAPILSAEEEHDLATRLYENNDLEAAKKLIMAHLRYVVRAAKGYQGYGLPLGDLIQEGNIGLMKAVKKFDPNNGVRLVTYAVHWIKSEIHEFVIKNWNIVKIATTKAQRKLFFNLRQMKKRLGWFTDEEINAVANDLGVKPQEVLQMEQRLNAINPSFDTNDSEENHPSAPSSYLTNDVLEPSMQLEMDEKNYFSMNVLPMAMAKLDPRSQDILQKRWLSDQKSTLHELAASHNISAERVRQLESIAIKELKSALSS